jgi:hypothetical protein
LGSISRLYTREWKGKYQLSSLPGDWRLFNEAIGLPLLPETNLPHKLLPFQDEIGEYPGKDLIVNKPNKCGMTETILRKLAMMCTVAGGPLMSYDVILGSSQDQLAEENLRRLEHLFENSDLLRPMIKEAIVTRMILTNETRFLTMPSNPSAMRSWPRVKAVFLDEAAHIGRLDDTEYFAAASSRLANTNGYMYIVSTPRGQRGFFHDLWTRAKAGKIQMKTFTVSYREGLGVMYTQEFIDKERDRLGPRFPGEYENEFLGAENAAIEAGLLKRGEDDYEMDSL